MLVPLVKTLTMYLVNVVVKINWGSISPILIKRGKNLRLLRKEKGFPNGKL